MDPQAVYGSPVSLAFLTKRKYDQMLRHRDGLRAIYRLLSKYLLLRQSWFGDTSYPTRVVRLSVSEVSDDTAIDAARASSTAFGGALWPNAEESFEIVPHPAMRTSPESESLLQSEEVKRYYAEVTHRIRQPFGDPDAGFLVAFGEHQDEQIVFGTSGIVAEEDETNDVSPCKFKSISVETAVIDEGPDHKVDTVCFDYTLTVRQVVEKYGLAKCSERTRALYKTPEGADTYIKILHMLRPRPGGVVGAEKLKKPIASIHMEADQLHVLKEDGMDDMPAFVVRFRKRPGEFYGRSLGMDALPTIKELNVIRRSFSLALAKQLDPPVGFRHDQLGGAGTVDLSPGAKNPIYNSGHIDQTRPPVEQLQQIPDPRIAHERVQEITTEIVPTKFLLDKLLDFNNKTRMTLGEAQMRTDFRNQALGNLFARQMTELLHPLIMWVVKVYWRRNLLGLHPVKDRVMIALLKLQGITPFVMPQVVADFAARGRVPFAVRFISPAARAMRADALLGLEKLSNYVLALVTGGFPDAGDNFDYDESIELYRHHVGAPQKALRAGDRRDEVRQQRHQSQMQMAQLQAQEQQSGIAKNAAKAAKDYAQAGVNPQGALSLGA